MMETDTATPEDPRNGRPCHLCGKPSMFKTCRKCAKPTCRECEDTDYLKSPTAGYCTQCKGQP